MNIRHTSKDSTALIEANQIIDSTNFDTQNRPSRGQLEEQLADAKLLQQISIELIHELGSDGLYKKIVEAAAVIMHSQYASMQMLVAENASEGKLQLLASSGFTAEAEKFWEWVYHHTGSSCGEALRSKRRAIIPNFRTCEFMQGTPTLPIFLESGILAAQSTPLYSRNGRLLGMISTHWDHPHTPSERDLSLLDILARQAADLIDRNQITEELKKSEERLRALSSELEIKVEERTKELQRSNEDLQKFAHVASHDLKEPVRKIKTFTLRLEDELHDHSNQKIKHYTAKVLESAARMSTMIEGVLEYSSVNRLEENIGTVDLNKIIADIRVDLEVQIKDKQAEFNYTTLPSVKGVEVLLYHVFSNIISNSLKFSKNTERPVIKIDSATINLHGINNARIVVADNGIGFDSIHKGAIFNSFTRLHSKDEYDGTGLGLSLAKNIVQRHNGTIEANGEKGVGASIIITLPIPA